MAGKIPQSFIYDIIERTDIVEIIDSRVKLKKTGRNYSACCPFHQEKTPSFTVNPDKQFYYCFGCGAGGNVISFLMDFDRNSFVEAIESIAHSQGIKVPREDNISGESPHLNNRAIYDLLEQAKQYFQQQLQHSDKNKAIIYLKQRGLTDEICLHFGVGYAPAGWNNLLPKLAKTNEDKQALIDSGMLIEKEDKTGVYDRFRERLMFPIRDNRGRTIAFGGRVLNDEKPKYLNSPETSVFHKQLELYGLYEARQSNRHLERILMVEGYMDVIALAQFGITYAVATLGTAAGTAHMEKVFRHCNEVIFCFDGDEAGRKAALRALEAVIPLMEGGRQAKFLFLPDGEDPDSFIRKIGKEKFIWHLSHAQSLSEYLFELHGKNLELHRTDDKAKYINNLMPSINALPVGTFQELMLRSLSEKTGLPLDDLKKLELENHQFENQSEETWDKKPQFVIKNTPKQREKLNNEQRLVKRTPAKTAIALLVIMPELAEQTQNLNKLEDDSEDVKALKELMALIIKDPLITPGQIIGYGQAHRKQIMTQLISMETNDSNRELQIQEYHDAIAKLIKNKNKAEQTELIENLRRNPNLNLNELSETQKAAFQSIFKKH